MARHPLFQPISLLAVLMLASLMNMVQAANNVRSPTDMRTKYSGASMSCLVANDFYAVHFTSMQQGRGKGESHDFMKYCQEIPQVGMTYLTLDLLDRDVRNIPISLRVVEEEYDRDGNPSTTRTLKEVPAKIYKNGTLDTSIDIATPGHYAVIAEIGDDMITEDDRLRIPFSVAMPSVQPTPWLKYMAWLSIGLVFAVIGWLGFTFYRRYWPNLLGKAAGSQT
ncbi:MAG: hypothetical protein RLZZ09_684 [Pseudomonadota bacterium]|jgi:hypothetical protein